MTYSFTYLLLPSVQRVTPVSSNICSFLLFRSYSDTIILTSTVILKTNWIISRSTSIFYLYFNVYLYSHMCVYKRMGQWTLLDFVSVGLSSFLWIVGLETKIIVRRYFPCFSKSLNWPRSWCVLVQYSRSLTPSWFVCVFFTTPIQFPVSSVDFFKRYRRKPC